MKPPTKPTPDDLSGLLLLADPSLHDGTFDKSVVYMLEDSPSNGSLGIILNHPIHRTVGDLIASSQFSPIKNIPVFNGGPVDREQLMFTSFQLDASGHWQCYSHLTVDEAIEHSTRSGHILRAFAGHSAWQPGQLRDELERNAWFITETREPTLIHPQDKSLWTDTLNALSPYHQIIALTPDNPLLN